MRQLLEMYRWMWRSIGRWRGGPVWKRTLLFGLYVIRDLVATTGRTRAVVGLAGLALLGLALITYIDTPESSIVEPAVVEVTSAGMVRFQGEVMDPLQFERIVNGSGVSSADIAIDADATYGTVDGIHRIMREKSIAVTRVRLVGMER